MMITKTAQKVSRCSGSQDHMYLNQGWVPESHSVSRFKELNEIILIKTHSTVPDTKIKQFVFSIIINGKILNKMESLMSVF